MIATASIIAMIAISASVMLISTVAFCKFLLRGNVIE